MGARGSWPGYGAPDPGGTAAPRTGELSGHAFPPGPPGGPVLFSLLLFSFADLQCLVATLSLLNLLMFCLLKKKKKKECFQIFPLSDTLPKGDNLMFRSMLTNRTVCLHFNVTVSDREASLIFFLTILIFGGSLSIGHYLWNS